MAFLRILLLISFITVVQNEYASASCEGAHPKLCNMLFSYDLIIRARVIETEIVKDKNDPNGVAGWKYTVNVLKSYRGAPEKKAAVRSKNTSTRLLLTPGKEYVIFASRRADGNYEAGNYCGGIQGIDGEPYSSTLETQIQDLLNSSGPSFIEGEVRDKNFKPVSGAALYVKGKGFSKRILVENDGSFSLKVKPGTYTVTHPNNLEVSEYSPDGHNPDPHSEEIPPKTLVSGQCMQIQLQEK